MIDEEEETKKPRRKNSIRYPGFDYSARRPYFVTIVCHERNSFFKNTALAEKTIKTLLELRGKYRFNIYQYCLMPNHFHAVLGPGDSGLSLSTICGYFKSLSTRKFWESGKGPLWQRGFYDHVVRNDEDFSECVKYIRMNLVRKGLVEDWETWKYSGHPDLERYIRRYF